ncbi:MAG: hypothetical protein FJ207_04510 [Gemmatimonadetes bacterium]|nr:hypothetical protein [Gemmatimonadota bacterium]
MTGSTGAPRREWDALTPREAREAARRDPVIVLPLAATEQHGPHLPASTDVDIGLGILDAAFRQLPPDLEVWTLPVVRVGASLEHTRFAGTQSVTTEEMIARIVELGAELARSGVRRIVLFNSHGGNQAAVDAAALILRAEHDLLVVKANYFRFARPTDVALPDTEWRHGLHGGALETAMMLHLRPELVRREAVADFPSLGARLEESLRRVRPEGEAPFAWLAGDLNPMGVVGDASLGTSALGARLVEHYGRILAEIIRDACTFPLDTLTSDRGSSGDGHLDERTAWALVLGTTPGAAERGFADGVPSAWLEVGADGSWRASGRVTPAARDVFDLYLPIRSAPDFVIGQLGQSLDGRIATDAGASHFVTGPQDIQRLHRLRALVDAVVVGAGTVELDDPRLTVRLVEGPSPVRVVLDPSERLDEGRKVFTDSAARTLVVVREAGSTRSTNLARGEIRVPWSESTGFDLPVLLDRLRRRGLRRILVEGGGVTVSRFLQAGLLDRLHLTVAPMLIGSGRPSITLPPIASLEQALRPGCRRFILGEDVLFDLDLRRGSA